MRSVGAHDVAKGLSQSDTDVRRAARGTAIQTISAARGQIPDDWLADFPTETWWGR